MDRERHMKGIAGKNSVENKDQVILKLSGPSEAPKAKDDLLPSNVSSQKGDLVDPRLYPKVPLQDPAIDSWLQRPESCREEGMKRLAYVNEARALKKGFKGRTKETLKSLAEAKNLSVATLYRYLKKADRAREQAEKTGKNIITAQLLALTPKYGKNRGNYRAWEPAALHYAKSLYLGQEYLNITEVYRLIQNEARVRGWRIGSYASLKIILEKELSPGLKTLGRQGVKKYQAKHELKILRNYEEIPPNFMWVGDHHIFDVFVIAPGGKILRPWLTAWMDVRSRSIMGWCISFQPNSYTVALALRHGVLKKEDKNFPQHGLPLSVYIDNGKDYKSKYLNGEQIEIGKIDYPEIIERFAALGIDPFYIDLSYDPEEDAWVKKEGSISHVVKGIRIGGVFSRLGIRARYATAYHPWAKSIERYFRDLVQTFSRRQRGWCGSNPQERPEKLAWEIKTRHLLTFEELCRRFYEYIVYDYHTRSHRGHGMDGMSPNEVFRAYGAPQEVDPPLLDFALLRKDQVKIYNWGFKLLGRDMELDVPCSAEGAIVLNTLIGTYATVLYDTEFRSVRVYSKGRFICSAKPLERASYIRADDKVMQEKIKLQRYQRRHNKEMLKRLQSPGEAELQAVELLSEAEASPEKSHKASLLPGIPGDDQHKEDPQVIYLEAKDRYMAILRMIARGESLSTELAQWKREYEASEEYRQMRALFEERLQFMKYEAERRAS